ncbi:hypothetical protein M0802_007691 [Mischocyttarus mexicanus]|nr:hypothetical protein M0802_007691 [Mischocyttarus mexicanus]
MILSRGSFNKMDRIVFGLTFLIVSSGISGAAGTCVHVENDDMLEYSCVGGHPGDLLSIPTETEKIRINRMRIPFITADMFSRFSNLWVLACSKCDIVDIEPNAFQSLVNLQQLSLDDNHLRTVKGSWFKGLEYLTYLDLNYNAITTIEDEVYENLPNLIDFRLSGNRFECMNSQAMENLFNLKRIFLSENPEFKCPNAISKFLDARGISFDKDSQWKEFDEVSVDSMFVDHLTETSTDWSSMPDHRKRLHFPTTEDTRSTERTSSTFETIHYPLYAPVRVTTTSDYNERISQFPSVDSSTIVANTTTNNKPEVPQYPPTIVDPYLPDTTTTTITTEQPSRYPSTQPWPIVTEDYNKNREQLEYSEEYFNPTRTSFPLDSSPMNRETLPPNLLLDPRYILSTQSPDIHFTENGILIEPNYPRPNPPFNPDLDKNDMEETIAIEDIRLNSRLPQIPPEIVQPAAPSDFHQVPYYEPTVTVRRPLPPTIVQNYEEQLTTVVETTTTDKPKPDCQQSSSISVELTPILIFLTFILNVIVLRF